MEADRWIDRVSSQKTHLPEIAELTGLEAELRGLLHDLRESEGRLEPVQRAYEDVAAESGRLKKRVNDLDATLTSSTANARELTALQSELEHVRTLLGECEDRELERLVEFEVAESEIASIKQHAQPGVLRRTELMENIAQLQASLEEELVSLRVARSERTSALSAQLLARYDVAMARVGTSGAAQVVEGRCDGCRIALSPLDYDRFRAQGVDTFMECAECGRLLLP
jgi:hypothetical protein